MYPITMTNEKQLELEQKIIALLPHGSGINYNWHITITKEAIIAKNKYNLMTEHGYYDDIFPFSIKFTPTNIILHFHNIQGNRYKKIKETGLREYLESTFANIHDEIKPYIITGTKIR